jgi:hypothetical protein
VNSDKIDDLRKQLFFTKAVAMKVASCVCTDAHQMLITMRLQVDRASRGLAANINVAGKRMEQSAAFVCSSDMPLRSLGSC